MYGRYYVISLVWRGRQFTMTVFRDQLGKLQRPQAQKIVDKVYPGSRVINFHESDPTSDPVLMVREARQRFIIEAKKNCGEGKYYCFDEQKCKPLPDGMTIGKDGMLQKEGVNKNKNCGCGKKPCITYGSYDDTPSDNPTGQTGEDASNGMSEQHYGAEVNKIPKELDAAVKMHASQSKRLKNSKEFKKDAGKEANKIPAELDKAVAMHKSQAKRLRAASVKEEAPKGKKYERMIKHIKKSYAKDGALTKDEKSIAYATAWKHKNKNANQRLGETYFYAGDSKEEFKDKAAKKKENAKKKKSVVPSTDVPTFPQDQVSEDWQRMKNQSHMLQHGNIRIRMQIKD